MKKSKTISLVLIASMTAITVGACSAPQPDLEGKAIFSSVEECAKESKESAEQCKKHHDRAALSHLLKAPRYADEGTCLGQGHQKCESVALDGATAWLPLMVGFMVNDRPVYLKKYDQTTVEYEDENGEYQTRDLTEDEKKDRAVVAGPSVFETDQHYDHSSVVVLGGWYPSPYYYSYGFSRGGSLGDGMRASYARVNGGSLPSGSRLSAPRANYGSVRGTVGGSGRSSYAASSYTTMGGGSRVGASSRGGFGGSGRAFGGGHAGGFGGG